ncbi:MAG: response regulator with a DNA-binding domain [Myxococcales bacterium]|nr:response regulator with a DNA-binding domain [Myxococcales bacterium]
MKILIVDDHAVVREGLMRILSDEIEGLIVDEATTAPEALAKACARRWDVVILDLSLPGRGGLDVLKEIHQQRPALPVLVMTMYSEEQYAVRAFRSGAVGYLTKGCPSTEVVVAVRKVAAGGKYVTPSVAEKLAGSMGAPTHAAAHEALSDRELQVLRMLAVGRSVKEIGNELALSEKTISTYRTRMLQKLELRTTSDLIRYALRAGLVD